MRRFSFLLVSMAIAFVTLSHWAVICVGQDDSLFVQLQKDTPKKLDVLKGATNAAIKSAEPIQFGQGTGDNAIGSMVLKDQQLTIAEKGAYAITFSFKVNGADKESKLLVQVGDPPKAQDPPKAENPPKAPGVFGGQQANPATLRQNLQLDPNTQDFKSLVLQLAKSWGSVSSDKNHRDYVARFDYTPADTCTKIAGILRDAAKGLDVSNPDVTAVENKMRQDFEYFYNSGKSEYRLKNPYADDWKPFLQRLEIEARSKIPDAKKSDPKFLQLMLLELADGFAQLGDEFRGVTSRTNSQAAGSDDGSGQASTGNDQNCRRRRRCRCSSLLFGF